MFERIFLPVDGSESSGRATRLAIDLAKASGGEVVVFHVQEQEDASRAGIDIATLAESRELVEEAVRSVKDAGVSARGNVCAVPIETVAREIVDAALTEDADVIVMGTRGLSDWTGLFLGSVTNGVIHATAVPILLTR